MGYGIIGNDVTNKLIKYTKTNKYCLDDNELNINEKTSLSIIFHSIKNNSHVLDVGCSYGLLGNALYKNKKCHIDGLEIDEEAIDVAKKKNCYDRIEKLDISKKDFIKKYHVNKRYDYIVFADVLEHLVDTTTALLNSKKILKEDGKIIISVPNVSHSDIILGLINGNFNYSEMGILDNTHLRFFTKKSFIDYLLSINEEFKTNFYISNIYKTEAKSSINDKYEDFEELIADKDSRYTLQWIFEITIRDNNIQTDFKFKDNNLKRINNALVQLKKEQIENKTKIVGFEKQIDELRKTLDKSKENEMMLGKKIYELEKKCLEQNEIISWLNSLINNLKIVCNEEKNKSKIISMQLKEIKNSNSWRITYPLRRIKDYFMKRG